jgi:hypothetical protein
VSFGLTASLIAGSVPGVCLGAYGSARAPDRLIRPVLVLVLAVSALKLLGASNQLVGVVAGGLAALGVAWTLAAGRLGAEVEDGPVDAESAQAGGE